MSAPRVAVTGRGLVTCLGQEPGALLDALGRGASGASPVERRDGLPVERVGLLRDFDLTRACPTASLRRLMSRESALASAAARLALDDAGLGPDDRERTGIYAGTGATALDFPNIVRMVNASAGDGGSFDEARFAQRGLKAINPVLSFQILPNMPPCFVSIAHGLQGDNLVFNPWEGQTGLAFVEAWHALRASVADRLLVGGSDVKTHSQAFVFLAQAGVPLGPGGCTPGEGAAYVVLERTETAAARGRRPLALLSGAAQASDPAAGWDATTDPNLLEGLIRRALDLASVAPGDVAAVVLSANGVADADRAELEALRRVLRTSPHLVRPKAGVADTFAAAGAVAAALAPDLCTAGPVLVNCFGNGRERACLVFTPAEDGAA